MSDTTEPKKAWVGYKSKIVWSVWLFSGFGLLLHFFPLDVSFPDFGSLSHSGGAVASPTQPEKAPVPCEVVNPGISAEVVNASEDDGQLLFDNGTKEEKLDVPVGRWSSEVVTPAGSKNYRLDVKPDNTCFYVKYADGHIDKIGGGEKRFKDVKIRRGIMRFYGTVPGQKATVTID